jgi:phosphate-selective porin OprO/OprP
MQSHVPKRHLCFLLALFLGISSVFAQDEAGDQSQDKTEQIKDAESGQPDSGMPQKQIKKSTDVREAILENLDLKAVEEAEEVSAPPESEQTTQEDETAPPVEAEDNWYDRFDPIIERIRRVPVLSDKGWLHFGRVELEYGYFNSSDLLKGDSGFNFRSLRSGIIKLFDNGAIVKLDIDLTDGDSNFTDMYIRFDTKLGKFTLGNQKIAHSFVNQTSRLARTFMEEPLPADAFGLIRRLGAGWDFHRKRVGVHLTAFGPDLNNQEGDFGYGARLYTNPTRTQWSLAHIGVSGVRESMDRDARFRARPESRVTDTFLVDTGKDADVETLSIFGLEMAIAHKNWSIRSEVFYSEWDRKTRQDTSFDGYYLQANWVLTGESFQYKQGKFMRIRPDKSRGAWEVALRYSTVDLNDRDVFGGEESNTTLALNWYGPGNQLRVQSNLIHVDANTVAGNESSLIAQIRVQVHW